MRSALAALVLVLAAASQARADDPPAAPAAAPPPAAEAPAAGAAPKPGRRMGVMAMKPVVCREVPDAKGKTGPELAAAIEQMGASMIHGGYHLAGLIPGDPPIACFSNNSDPANLPRGAR